MKKRLYRRKRKIVEVISFEELDQHWLQNQFSKGLDSPFVFKGIQFKRSSIEDSSFFFPVGECEWEFTKKFVLVRSEDESLALWPVLGFHQAHDWIPDGYFAPYSHPSGTDEELSQKEQLEIWTNKLTTHERKAIIKRLDGKFAGVLQEVQNIIFQFEKENDSVVLLKQDPYDYLIPGDDLWDVFEAVIRKMPRDWFSEDFLNKLQDPK